MTAKGDPLDALGLKHPQELLAGLDYALVIEFFSVFSRFEYALKICGYLRSNKEATPAWQRFASEMIGQLSLVPSKKLKKAVEFLSENPPKNQMKNLEWQDVHFPAICIDCDSKAIIAATRVRNNLFHGGKYLNTEPESDSKLIQSSLTVIYGCLLVRAGLKEAYDLVR
ncbi:hypothetical protein ACTUTK_06980 [Pantoea ananatis]|jgi:hypothetical protein|uniref:hypothetical protein n=1 Tax=Pantoea ananas TaxID=553 RepID=UPI003FA43C1D